MFKIKHSVRRSFARLCVLVALCSCGMVAARGADAGVWVRQRSPSLAWLRAVHFHDARLGWIAGSNGTLLRTTDGGERWEKMPRPTDDTILDVHFADRLRGWLLCEAATYTLKKATDPRSYILRTTDAGKTWARSDPTRPTLPRPNANLAGFDPTLADPDSRLVRLAFVNDSVGWTFGESGALYATDDGGATWTKQTLDSRFLILGAAFLDTRQGWLVGGGGTVWRTVDAGVTWRESRLRSSPATATSAVSRLRAVAFTDARRGWAVGTGGQVWTTMNGGGVWARQNSGTDDELLDVASVSATDVWAVGMNGTIIGTTSGGRTWTPARSPVGHRLESICAAPGGSLWAVGFGGTILKTRS